MIEETTKRVTRWLRQLHGAGMSIAVLKFERDPSSREWTAYASHSGMGSASSRKTGGSLADPAYHDHPSIEGVQVMVMTKPADKRLPLGFLRRAEMLEVIAQLRAVTGAAHHDVWDLPDLPHWISMRTWGLDQHARRHLSHETLMGLMTGSLICRSGRIQPVEERPDPSAPVMFRGLKMSVLRPCGCVTHHWSAPGKGAGDSARKRRFGEWLAVTPCLSCQK